MTCVALCAGARQGCVGSEMANACRVGGHELVSHAGQIAQVIGCDTGQVRIKHERMGNGLAQLGQRALYAELLDRSVFCYSYPYTTRIPPPAPPSFSFSTMR
jgi:hypothetical protein